MARSTIQRERRDKAALEEFNPYWVEEPVIPDTMRALADVRSRVKVPIACGERLYTTQQILDAIEYYHR